MAPRREVCSLISYGVLFGISQAIDGAQAFASVCIAATLTTQPWAKRPGRCQGLAEGGERSLLAVYLCCSESRRFDRIDQQHGAGRAVD